MELFQGDSYIPLIRSRTHFLSDTTRCFRFIFLPLSPALESAIFPPKKSGSFCWRIVCKNHDEGVGYACCCSGVITSRLPQEILHTHTHTHVCMHTHMYTYLLLKIYGKFQAYTKVQILTTTQLEQ